MTWSITEHYGVLQDVMECYRSGSITGRYRSLTGRFGVLWHTMGALWSCYGMLQHRYAKYQFCWSLIKFQFLLITKMSELGVSQMLNINAHTQTD